MKGKFGFVKESNQGEYKSNLHKNLKVRCKAFKIFLLLVSMVSCLLAGCSLNSNNADKSGKDNIKDNTNDSNKDKVCVDFINVGKGDCIVIRYNQYTYMIDTGYDDTVNLVMDFLNENNISKIDGMIITHFDKDHVGGAKQILKNYTVEKIYMPNYVSTGSKYEKFINYLNDKALWNKVNYVTEDVELTLDEVTMKIKAPKEESYSQENDYSLVTRLDYKEDSFLFAGDAEVERIQELIDDPDLDCDVLKVPYHGNSLYNNIELVNQVSPEYSIITCESEDAVSENLLSALEDVGSEIYFNCNGNISCVADGTGNIQVNQ